METPEQPKLLLTVKPYRYRHHLHNSLNMEKGIYHLSRACALMN